MELHRLKEMPSDYDPDLFNRIYNDCRPYMDKLARSINPKYYNVTEDIIRSWFDDKFIFVYNKYHNEMSDKSLKSYILKSLKQVRCNILRRAYSETAENNIKMLSTDDEENWVKYQLSVIEDKNDIPVNEKLLEEVKAEMKKTLGEDEYFFFNLTLNPPPAVLNPKYNHIPNKKWVKFLGLPDGEESDFYIDYLKYKVQLGINQVRKRYRRNTIKFKESYYLK